VRSLGRDAHIAIRLLDLIRRGQACLSQFFFQHLDRAADAQQRFAQVRLLGLDFAKFGLSCLKLSL